MGVCMALTAQLRTRKQPARAPFGVNAEAIDRQARVQQLRQMVALGTYKVSSQRLALKILVRALQEH